MTFNGLTENQADNLRIKYGSNAASNENTGLHNIAYKLAERFGRIPVKIYIIIILAYILLTLVCGIADGGFANPEQFTIIMLVQLALFVAVAVNCLTELYYENKAAKALLDNKKSGRICKCYRCGNRIVDADENDIVRNDYVLVMKGDIIPADGMIVYGDITVDDGTGSKLIRNFAESETDDLLISRYTVSKHSVVTSGYAVMRVTSPGGRIKHDNIYNDKLYNIFTAAAVIFVILVSHIIPFISIGFVTIQSVSVTAAIFAPLILLAWVRIFAPEQFIFKAWKNSMKKDGADAKDITGDADIFFIDKSCFAGDGKPFVTAFIDAQGNSYSECHDIPYPLGTIFAKAAVENSAVLANRERYFGDAEEIAVIEFIRDRITSTVDLEIKSDKIKGMEKSFDYRKLIHGMPGDIIPKCDLYYDAAGERQTFSSKTAVMAMAEELFFIGNNVEVYAAMDFYGKISLIGMVVIRERLRENIAGSFKALSKMGIQPVLLSGESESEDISLSDKSITGAGRENVISMEELASSEPDAAAKRLSDIKIITGEADKELLIYLAHIKHRRVGMTMISYADREIADETDISAASDMSCEAAKMAADGIMSDGAFSIAKFIAYNRKIKRCSVIYKIFSAAVLVITAVCLTFSVGFRNMVYELMPAVIMINAAVEVLLFKFRKQQ